MSLVVYSTIALSSLVGFGGCGSCRGQGWKLVSTAGSTVTTVYRFSGCDTSRTLGVVGVVSCVENEAKSDKMELIRCGMGMTCIPKVGSTKC